MRTVEGRDAPSSLEECIALAQSESLVLVRDGAPAAVVIGVEGHELEEIQFETDPRFWAMIEERRQQPTLTRAELDDYLRQQGEHPRR